MEFYLGAPGIVGGDDDLALVEATAIGKLSKTRGFLALAKVYQNTDEEEKLKALYVSAEQQHPDNAAILFNRGMYHQSQKKFGLAVADFQQVQGLKPEDDKDTSLPAALYQIGRSSVLSGDDTELGIKALHAYIETAPVDYRLPSKPWARYRLGLLYAKSGDTKTSVTLYEQAKAATEDKTLLKDLKKELKKSR